MSSNKHLRISSKTKNDEFPTPSYYVNELIDLYKPWIFGKKVFCNCDTDSSEFPNILTSRQKELNLGGLNWLGLRKDGTGGFETQESINILRQSDLVFTNPPFSLKNQFLDLLIEERKEFIFVAPITCFSKTYIEYYNKGLIDTSYSRTVKFDTKNIGVVTITSFKNPYKQKINYSGNPLKEFEDKTGFPVINKINDLPPSWDDWIYVPITFLQYQESQDYIIKYNRYTYVGGKEKFLRLLVKKK